jgi:hypothetical protein
MSEEHGKVEEEVKPESESSTQIATAKRWALNFGVPVIVALVTSVAGWTKNHADSQERAGQVKNQAEAGFQQNKNFLDEQDVFNRGMRNDVQRLKEDVAELKRRQIRPVKRKESTKTAAVAAVPAPTPPPPLPSAPIAPTLDKALEQIQQQQKTGPEAAPPPK